MMDDEHQQYQNFKLLLEHRFISEFTHFSHHVIWMNFEPSVLPVQTIKLINLMYHDVISPFQKIVYCFDILSKPNPIIKILM